MVVVSTRDFRTNQTRFLNLARAGEHVILRSRAGRFRITPVDADDAADNKRDLIADLRGALHETKEYLAGKRQMQTLESLIDEL